MSRGPPGTDSGPLDLYAQATAFATAWRGLVPKTGDAGMRERPGVERRKNRAKPLCSPVSWGALPSGSAKIIEGVKS